MQLLYTKRFSIMQFISLGGYNQIDWLLSVQTIGNIVISVNVILITINI